MVTASARAAAALGVIPGWVLLWLLIGAAENLVYAEADGFMLGRLWCLTGATWARAWGSVHPHHPKLSSEFIPQTISDCPGIVAYYGKLALWVRESLVIATLWCITPRDSILDFGWFGRIRLWVKSFWHEDLADFWHSLSPLDPCAELVGLFSSLIG